MKEKEWGCEVGKRNILFELTFKTNGGVKLQILSTGSVVLFHQGLEKHFFAHARETAFIALYFLAVSVLQQHLIPHLLGCSLNGTALGRRHINCVTPALQI